MNSTAFGLIQQAIQQGCSIEADYKGHRRQLSPYVLGYTKTGREHALLYQYAGGSSSGLGPIGSGENWRCLHLDELENVSLIPDYFERAPASHGRPQTCVFTIVIVVNL